MRRRPHYDLCAFTCGLLTALSWGCNTGDKGTLDSDGDGWEFDEDCDDGDYDVNPGAIEICGDGIDNDCDGVDPVCAVDSDGDGWDTPEDCDDSDPSINPGEYEDCLSYQDDNCDGIISECLDPALTYEPSTPGSFDAYDAAVFADYVVFGEPGDGNGGAIGDGRALFFEHVAGVVSELDAAVISDGAVGEAGAYGTSTAPLGDSLCITADYQDDGAALDAGKSWCFSDASVRAAATSGSLALADASFTTLGGQQGAYAKVEAEADVDGDGSLDLLVYGSQGMDVIFGNGSPWSGDYLVASDSDRTLGNCASSSSGWCGFGRALNGAAPLTLALSEEGGTPDTISFYSLPLVGGSTVPTGSVQLDRGAQDSATGVGLIAGWAFGDLIGATVSFVDSTGTIVGTAAGTGGFGYWVSTFVDARGDELLLVSAPYDWPGDGGGGMGVVYVFNLTDNGLPTAAEQAVFQLTPPDLGVECGWRARGGLVEDGDRTWTVVAVSCPGYGGASYWLGSVLAPPPPVYSSDIYATGTNQYEIRQWVVDAYTSELEWMMSLAQTEAVVAQGSIVGWRLHAIEPGSPLFRAGLRSNDLIRRVNGVEVTTPTVVNQLYSSLKDANELTVRIFRGGNPRLLQYTIVP